MRKKFLLSLFGIITLGLINFSSSYSYTYTGTIDRTTTNKSKNTFLALPLPISPDRLYTTDTLNITCNLSNVSVSNSSLNQLALYKGVFSTSDLTLTNSFGSYVSISSSMTLTYVGVVNQGYQFGIRANTSYLTDIYFDYSCVVSSDGLIGTTCPTCPSCSQCESDLLTCQSDLTTCQNSSSNCDYSDYESTINTLSGNLAICEGMYDRLESDYELLSGNYSTCVSDLNSCMNGCGSSGEGDIQWSSLFINDNQLLGNKNIFINIPFDIDYSYTNTGEDFELSVVGLNQDTEYLSGIINKQNYIPTTEDLSNVMSNFGLFGGLLVVCLFVILVFYMIKKIFK